MTKKKLTIRSKIIIVLFLFLLLTTIASIIFLTTNQYVATDESGLSSNEYVTVSEKLKINRCKYYFFDGPGDDTALIFYQGSGVDEVAYANMLNDLAQKGVDCFLLDNPLSFPLSNTNAAGTIIENYEYDHWYVGGHSLGGVCSCMFTESNINIYNIEGIILLASYLNKDLSSTNLKVLSIYGTEDGVLNMEKYEENKANLPVKFTEYIIEGGNHAGFGNYGKQRKDGVSTISALTQQQLTVNKIIEFINEE